MHKRDATRSTTCMSTRTCWRPALTQQSQAEAALKHFEKSGRVSRKPLRGTAEERSARTSDCLLRRPCLRSTGRPERAKKYFAQSADQPETEPWPETRFYQALSLAKLGDRAAAEKVYDQLVDNGQKRLKDQGSADFFAKFGQEQTRRSQLATAHYLLGLGLLGKGDQEQRPKNSNKPLK